MYVACLSFLTGIKIAIIAEIQIAVFVSDEPLTKHLLVSMACVSRCHKQILRAAPEAFLKAKSFLIGMPSYIMLWVVSIAVGRRPASEF